MIPSDVLMSLVFGVVAYFVTAALHRVLTTPSRKRQYAEANERFIAKVHELVRAKNEIAIIELELAELAESAPFDRARWIVHLRDLAGGIPPLVLEQARRFGLAEPPPDATNEEALTMRAPSMPPTSEYAQIVPQANPWTGR